MIVAPTVFNSLTEYPLVLILACFLLPMRSGGWRDELSFRRHLLGPLLVGAIGAGLLLLTEGHVWEHRAVFIGMGAGLREHVPQPAAIRPRSEPWCCWPSGVRAWATRT